MKSGSCSYNMIFRCANGSFGPVWVFNIGGDEVPFDLECFGPEEQGFALLVVHSDFVDVNIMLSEELHGILQGDRGVFLA